MRKLVIVLALACIAGLMVTSAPAAEMRGLWVDAFHPGFRNPEQTSAMVAKAKECGFNALFVQVRKRADAYYKSSIEPMADDVAPGYDPLADICKKAHDAGLEVHAWVSVFEVYHDNKWSQVTADHVYNRHADWLMKDERDRTKFPGDKVYLDPGIPEVREYLASVVEEIAGSYQVDGIHLDVVKYPSPSGGYNEASVARFNQEQRKTGKPSPEDKAWGAWRRAQMTAFIALAKAKVKQARKDAKLSASVSANTTDSLHNLFQDWPGWLKASLLDFAVPMVFQSDDRVFKQLTAEALGASNGKPVYIGQAGWKLKADRSAAQVAMVREAGAQGVVVYSYYFCSRSRKANTVSLMDTLKTSLFAKN
jgi:uncharacterized lipoprotein YddW (UPF0748 family)